VLFSSQELVDILTAMCYGYRMENNTTPDPTQDPSYKRGHFEGLNKLRVSSHDLRHLEGYEDGLMEREEHR
jgi:hypothetical protein